MNDDRVAVITGDYSASSQMLTVTWPRLVEGASVKLFCHGSETTPLAGERCGFPTKTGPCKQRTGRHLYGCWRHASNVPRTFRFTEIPQ